jgi:hypothetical protein
VEHITRILRAIRDAATMFVLHTCTLCVSMRTALKPHSTSGFVLVPNSRTARPVRCLCCCTAPGRTG